MRWSAQAARERDTMRAANFVGIGWVTRRAEDLARYDYIHAKRARYVVRLKHWQQARSEWTYGEEQ